MKPPTMEQVVTALLNGPYPAEKHPPVLYTAQPPNLAIKRKVVRINGELLHYWSYDGTFTT